jgi:hypothetical protein
MDYVTRQFINLTKKFRRELPKLAELLHRDLKQHTEAIRATQKRDQQDREVQPVWLEPVLAKYQEPVGEKKANDDRHYRVQNSIRWATWSAFIAASVYAGITFYQLKTAQCALREAKKSTSEQLGKLSEQIAQLKVANQIATEGNRPWIGMVPLENGGNEFSFHQGHEGTYEFAQLRYLWSFKNSGGRPAKIMKLRTTAEWLSRCDEVPNYEFRPEHVAVNVSTSRSHAIIIPGTTFKSLFIIGIPMEKWELVKDSKLELCVYALIEYRDVGGDQSIVHRTTECQMWVHVGDLSQFSQCNNSYANAN